MSQLERISPHLWRLADTCNVYLVVDGDAALAIDAGSGAVVERSPTPASSASSGCCTRTTIATSAGVRRACGSTARASPSRSTSDTSSRTRSSTGDAAHVRQLRRPQHVLRDRRGHPRRRDARRLRGVPVARLPLPRAAREEAHDGVEHAARRDRRPPVAFTGDLLARGGRLYQLHAMEYMYANLEGVVFTLQSIQALRKAAPAVALPSHGDPIEDVPGDVARLERRLMDVPRLGTGMGVSPTTRAFPRSRSCPEPQLQRSRGTCSGAARGRARTSTCSSPRAARRSSSTTATRTCRTCTSGPTTRASRRCASSSTTSTSCATTGA